MISFSSSKPNLNATPNPGVVCNNDDNNPRQVNNYETLEYEAAKYKQQSNKYSNEKDTCDLYSYQDNNNIYVEDDDDKIKTLNTLSKPKENVDYIKVTPLVTNNDNIKYVVDLNDLRNHLNNTNQSQTLNRLNLPQQQQQHYLNHDSMTLNPQMLRMNPPLATSTIIASTLPNTLHHQNQQQYHLYQDSQSLIPTLNRVNNNSVIVNQPIYQKSYDNLTLNSTNQQSTDLSKDTQITNQTINRSAYYYSSKSELNKGELSPVKAQPTNQLNISNGLACCRLFCGIIRFLFSCFNCFVGCCFKPCCSVGAIIIGFILLSVLLVGFVFAFAFGFIQLPVKAQEFVCKMDQKRQFVNSIDNQTNFKSFEFNNHTNNFNITNLDQIVNTTYLSNNLTLITNSFNNQTNLIQLAKQKKTKGFIKKLKSQTKLKQRLAKFVPLQYDVVFIPNLSDFDKNSFGIEMRINLSIKIYCYESTNIVYLSTRDFTTIEINFEHVTNEDGLNVKKWTYDTSSDILEIETNRNFTPNSLYKLNVFILYKNYGLVNSVFKNGEKLKQLFYLSFNDKFENPFPCLVEFNNRFATFTGSSVFNVSLIRPKSKKDIIFNTEILKTIKLDKSSLEFINFKPTPFVPIQTFSLILGDIKCTNDNEDERTNSSIYIKICSINQSKNEIQNSIDIIRDYVEKLLVFFQNYTKLEYPLKKLDIVILPSESIIELANDDQSFAQLGIIYLPEFFIRNLKTVDVLEQEQIKLKITHLISKQLSKHWFYKYQECHKQMLLFKEINENDFTEDTYYLVRSLCAESRNLTFCSNKDLNEQDSSFKAFLQYNVNCYLFKGIVNWLSYLSFKSINPDLFDLVFLEWSLIRELDEAYFFSNSNIKYIYQAYDYPRLTESNSLLKIKTEIKSLLSARTIYLLFGKDRFEYLIREWFRNLQMNTKSIDDDLEFSLNQTKSLNSKLIAGLNSNLDQNSILDMVEKYSTQYNIISLTKVEFKDVIRSWILAPNNIVLSLSRNYNKKDALIKLDYSNNSIINDVYFPLNWFSGALQTSEDIRKIKTSQEIQIKWVNKSNENLRELPGADKWLIGNYMKMFGQLRINYDEQNWLMLVKQLYQDHKSLNVNDRVQIIDDVFYLANNQKTPITNALNILEYIPREDNFLPWKYLVKNVKIIINYIEDDSQIYSKFRNYIIKLIEPTYKKLKWGESTSDTIDEKYGFSFLIHSLIRILVVDLLCSLDYEDCKENSVKQLSDSIKIRVYNIPQYLTKSIYCTAIRNTGITEWLFLWDYYLKQSDDSNMKDSLLYSLSCSSHIWILNLFLQKLVYENSIPVENLPFVFDYISQNPVGKYITWNHISQNYQVFYNKIGNDPDLFLKILQVSTKELKFKYEIKQLYDFIDEIGSKNITFYYSKNNKEKLFANIETRINRYSKWKNANANELNEWLSVRKISEIPEYFKNK